MRVPVVPFLTPLDGAIRHGGWKLALVDGEEELPRELPHWDYQTVLELAAPVLVDRRAVTTACQLEWDSGLSVIVLARSSHTKAEILAAELDVPLSDTFDIAIELQLDGRELGGRLTLETLLVSKTPKPLGPLAPRHPGSILWRCSHWTSLEGVGAQFPTETIDFTATGRDPRAGWALHIDLGDPDALFMSSTRLILNSGHAAIGKMLRGEKDDGTRQLLRTLHWDVTRQMVHVALQSDEVAGLDTDPETVSVAGILRNLLASVWPLESVVTLQNWFHNEPNRIEVHLQDHCGLLK